MGKIENRTLNERAYDEIKRSLIAGHFRPSDVLVTRTLAEHYGISTTPVREALQRLVGERQLVLLPNRSVAVPAWDVEKYLELARIRRELEGLAAELAAANITDKKIRALEKVLLDIEKSISAKDISAYVNLNQQFHFAIYESANSPRLLQMIQDVWGQVGPYFLELFSDPVYESVANTEHVLILESLKARDGAGVRKHIVADIASAAEVLEPRIQELASKDDRVLLGSIRL
ncbi:GntR family transcriptional regulator [Shinella sp.]|uniref:GntR family transcriptional regulator n=1 Tax=Shinella sp. TaxID=1870904 RepID=UPI003F710F79